MNISKEELKHIASISRINITEDKLDSYVEAISNVLDVANKIKEVNTDNIKETTHISENTNVFRKDEIKPSYSRDEILKNAPTKESGCISLPKVVE